MIFGSGKTRQLPPQAIKILAYRRHGQYPHLNQNSSRLAPMEPGPVKAHILVVDDETNVLTTVQAILQQEGYEVDAAPGGAQALAAIQSRHYDLVLTDLKMPVVDGLEVLSHVRKHSPETVTIMMTGYASLDSALEAVRLGAYEYLLKPTEVPQLKMAGKGAPARKRLFQNDNLLNSTPPPSTPTRPDSQAALKNNPNPHV